MKDYQLVNLRQQAESGDAEAMWELAAYYMEHPEAKKTLYEDVEWMQRAAEQGHPDAMLHWGVYYHEHLDEPKAAEWFKKSFEAGNTAAACYLGNYCKEGRGGMSVDLEQAEKYFGLGANEYRDAMNTDASRTMTQQTQPTSQSTISSASQSSVPRVVATPMQQPAPPPKLNYATLVDYTRYCAGTTSYTLEHDDKERRYYIPEKVMEFFDNEFDYRETANCEELTNLAVALFIGMAGGPASAPSSGGGGSSTDNNWGRDKNEDDLRWARRCAQMAIIITPRLKRGLHR